MLYNGRDTDPSIGTSGLSGSECSDMRHVTAVTVQKHSKPGFFSYNSEKEMNQTE
jgi:hypothetical protein